MTALDAVKARIAPLQEKLSVYPRLWEVFEHCFINTLETTVEAIAPGDTFIITGDIHAMWQRDSTAQVLHYLRFADDPAVASMIEGLIARQTENTLRDPYANSFNREETKFKLNYDEPLPNDWVWEQKYEVDSLCNPILLAWRYWEKTGSEAFLTERFHEALKTAARVFRAEQRHENSPYRFTRENCPYRDTLHHDGKGEPVGYTGMTWSGFRPGAVPRGEHPADARGGDHALLVHHRRDDVRGVAVAFLKRPQQRRVSAAPRAERVVHTGHDHPGAQTAHQIAQEILRRLGGVGAREMRHQRVVRAELLEFVQILVR